MNPRNSDHMDLKLAPGGVAVPERRLRRDYVCINSVSGSP